MSLSDEKFLLLNKYCSLFCSSRAPLTGCIFLKFIESSFISCQRLKERESAPLYPVSLSICHIIDWLNPSCQLTPSNSKLPVINKSSLVIDIAG